MKKISLRKIMLFGLFSQATVTGLWAGAATQQLKSQIELVITASDYVDFLNDVGSSDIIPAQEGTKNNINPNFLYDAKMGSDPRAGAIVRVGTLVSYEYFVIEGRENWPITFLNEADEEAYISFANRSQVVGYRLQEEFGSCDSLLTSNTADFEIETASMPTLSLASSSIFYLPSSGETKNIGIGCALIFGAVFLGSNMIRGEFSEKIQARSLNRPLTLMQDGYLFPSPGGGVWNGQWYTEHALERMAPEAPEIMKLLKDRVMTRAKRQGLRPGTLEFEAWRKENAPQLRGISVAVVEAELTHPGTTDVAVILSDQGDVITVIPRLQHQNKGIPDQIMHGGRSYRRKVDFGDSDSYFFNKKKGKQRFSDLGSDIFSRDSSFVIEQSKLAADYEGKVVTHLQPQLAKLTKCDRNIPPLETRYVKTRLAIQTAREKKIARAEKMTRASRELARSAAREYGHGAYLPRMKIARNMETKAARAIKSAMSYIENSSHGIRAIQDEFREPRDHPLWRPHLSWINTYQGSGNIQYHEDPSPQCILNPTSFRGKAEKKGKKKKSVKMIPVVTRIAPIPEAKAKEKNKKSEPPPQSKKNKLSKAAKKASLNQVAAAPQLTKAERKKANKAANKAKQEAKQQAKKQQKK